MFDWFGKLDPNVVVPVAIAVGSWLWHKVSGEKKTDNAKAIDSIIQNFANEVLDSYTPSSGDVTEYLKRVRKYMEDRVWLVLQKRGIARNRTTETLVNIAIEAWTAWVGSNVRRIREAKGLPA
jgi:hypothetical protein